MNLLRGLPASGMLEKGSLASASSEKLIGSRQIDSRHLHLLFVPKANANGTFADASAVVGGSVDGVDNPQVFVACVVDVFLLTDEAAARKQFAEPLAKEFLHGNVRRGDDVACSRLLGDAEVLCQHKARGLEDDLDKGMYHRCERCFPLQRYK